MSREVRRVPADWEHPKNGGVPRPMYDESFGEAVEQWIANGQHWLAGTAKYQREDDERTWEAYVAFEGECPSDPELYRPAWTDEERTHLMMYETTSEGTPISPAFAMAEELAAWLADTGASAFGDMGATYEQWLATIEAGSVPSAYYSQETGLVSGPALAGKHRNGEGTQ